MFYHICGELVLTETNTAVVDCNGVGYKLTVSTNTQRRLTHIGEKIKLYTYLCVREDGLELFGFYDMEEHSAFKMLISVSGVGPKAALNILSVMTPERFALAVTTGDTKAIAKAQNVGGKTAARIVLELKDKIAKEFSSDDMDSSIVESLTVSDKSRLSEAQNALLVLGYKQSEAMAALRGIDTEKMEIEDIIREALKKLMR